MFIYVDKSIWYECTINRRFFFRFHFFFFDKYSACGCGAASFRRRYEDMNKKGKGCKTTHEIDVIRSGFGNTSL